MGARYGGAVTRRHRIVIGPTLGEREEGNREVGKERNLEILGREEIDQRRKFLFVAVRGM